MSFKILLVDDNPIVLEAFGLALRRDGFDVETAASYFINGEPQLHRFDFCFFAGTTLGLRRSER